MVPQTATAIKVCPKNAKTWCVSVSLPSSASTPVEINLAIFGSSGLQSLYKPPTAWKQWYGRVRGNYWFRIVPIPNETDSEPYNDRMYIEGIFAAATTPFYADERVYFRKLEANVARYSRSLLAGIVVLGSTGEAVELNDAESREVLKVAADAAAAEKVLIAGVARESVRGTIELAEAAAEARYDAVLVRTPTYYVPAMSEAAA